MKPNTAFSQILHLAQTHLNRVKGELGVFIQREFDTLLILQRNIKLRHEPLFVVCKTKPRNNLFLKIMASVLQKSAYQD